MSCNNQVGVKNIMLTFHDCETDRRYGPISHQLATEELPTIRACAYSNEALPGGYVKRILSNAEIELSVVRDLRIPLAMYQGCSEIGVQIEYYNGLVYSAVQGTGTGDDKSDTHEVAMTLVYREIDELLPAGVLQAA